MRCGLLGEMHIVMMNSGIFIEVTRRRVIDDRKQVFYNRHAALRHCDCDCDCQHICRSADDCICNESVAIAEIATRVSVE